MLGDILGRLQEPGTAAGFLLERGDLALLADVNEAAMRLDLAPDAFVSLAVRRFADRADADAWLQLVAVIGRSAEQGADPGGDALAAILRRAVADVREAVS